MEEFQEMPGQVAFTPEVLNYMHVRYPDRDTAFNENLLVKGYARMPEVLARMGYEDLRDGQKPVVVNIMGGRDTYCVLPTSGGKSATFTIPTLCHQWHTLVFSPLVSLMRDQVQQLSLKGVRAVQVSSGQTPQQNTMVMRLWARGEVDVLYVAPERLPNPEFKQAMASVRPDFVAVDESHCFPGNFCVPTDAGLLSFKDLYQRSQGAPEALPMVRCSAPDGSGPAVYRRIKNVWRNPRNKRRMVSVRLGNDGFVVCTEDHVWITSDGEKKACDLVEGDAVRQMRYDLNATEDPDAAAFWSTVKAVYAFPSRMVKGSAHDFLYDLEVEENHNYFVMAHRYITTARPELTGSAFLVHNCLSVWGNSFRADYCHIGDFVAEMKPRVVAAFTATSSTEIEEDVRRVLGMNKATRIVHYYRRNNLSLHSDRLESMGQIARLLKKDTSGSSIIYFSTRKRAAEGAADLGRLLNVDVGLYTGGLLDVDRSSAQDLFMSDKIKIMCATKAFGMGVNKATIRQVIHRDIPDSLESLSQEVGRAGRDDRPSTCMTLYSDDSLRTQERFIRLGYPSKEDLVRVFDVLCQRADKDDIIKLTLEDIAKQVGIREVQSIGAIMTILSGSRVVERYRPETRTAMIRITGSSEEARFRKYMAVVRDVAVSTPRGLELDMAYAAEKLGVTEQTFRKYIMVWAHANLLDFEPPYKGSFTKIVGGLDLVDFNRMRQRKEWAVQKLDQVVRYTLEVADDGKHDYLEAYFNGMSQM